MNLIEIILIILGIIIIIISCGLVDHTKDRSNKLSTDISAQEEQFREEELKLIRGQLEKVLSKVSEEIVGKTDDELSRLSNEKIMAVGEYSDQILEKINHNHEEVIFLYHMLNEKEKELKISVRGKDISKKMATTLPESMQTEEQPTSVQKTSTTQQTNLQVQFGNKVTDTIPGSKTAPEGLSEAVETVENNNSRILALHSKGKSIVEISKLLELGQGEVKLVIDLFQGKM